MRSSLPTLMLERCAQAIEKVIIPNLNDDFACRQAMFIAVVLHNLAPDVEEKCEELAKENEGMRGILARVREVLHGKKALASNAVGTRLIRTLDLELQKVEINHPDIRGENHHLKGVLVETIKGLDALRNALPIETMSFLRHQIRSVLRQQLDRALTSRVATFEIKDIVEMK